MRKAIQLTVNGRGVAAEVEPRLQLADFVREHLLLTGTHLGCEHGVCGACTIEIDGAPARSCIAYAAACDGAKIRTIEGFDDDPLMADLREAFSAHHALQCGYCTPGMLVTARDIVMRLPDADEARIRKELAGNLCRCTGYVGIVKAIQSVLARRGGEPAVNASTPLPLRSARTEPLAVRPERRPKDEQPASTPQTTFRQSFVVDQPRDKVWDFFGRLGEVTSCLPGASIVGTPSEDHVDVNLRVKVGPIAADFSGAAEVERDAASRSGTIRGSARDTRSSSMTRGEIRYVLHEEKNGDATRVDVEVGYTLTGTLAQFGRSGLVQDIARRMTVVFAQNVEARLKDGAQPAAGTAELDAGSLFFSALWARVKALFGR